MKNVILFIAVIAMAVTAEAQTNKQVAGSKSLEVQVAPLGGSPIGLDGGIRFRTFSTETTAFRGTVFLGGSSSNDKSNVFIDGEVDPTEVASKNSNFTIQLRPGLEWHLVGTDKLSPYYGAEVLIGFSSDKSVDEVPSGTDIEEETTTQGTTQFGVNGVGGMDFYFAQNVFFGVEIGAGILYQSMGPTKSSSTVDGSTDFESPGGSSLTGGPNVNGSFRFGIIF